MILAIDSALPLLSVALVREGQTLGALTLASEGSRNEKLLPAVDWLLGEAGAVLREVTLFAVTRGPGSFTGVRIGLAMVQGLAFPEGKPVCAMSTHEALAGSGRLLVHSDAGRGERYATLFDGETTVEPAHLASVSEIEALSARADRVVDLSVEAQRINVALALAGRAESIAASGRLQQFADVTPLYVRLAEAEVKLRLKQNAAV
jgi:tRNA threonylcarbamoyl adenosine modification protein YeaZ